MWLYFQTGNTLRRFLRVDVSRDGSFYLTLGGRKTGVRMAQGAITIPAGETSASINYTDYIKGEFENFSSEHTGYKASGRVIHKFGNQYFPTSWDIPLDSLEPLLLQTIYPGRLETFSESMPKSADLILPRDLNWARTNFDGDIESATGNAPFHVEIWQIPPSASNIECSEKTLGLLMLNLSPRVLGIAICQDITDEHRGWMDKTIVLSRQPN